LPPPVSAAPSPSLRWSKGAAFLRRSCNTPLLLTKLKPYLSTLW
jgi:hypothetical protein